jgi:YegS/Rv2252/BmrU family lipid kinase
MAETMRAKAAVVINPGAGRLEGEAQLEELNKIFSAHGIDAEFILVTPDEGIARAAERAIEGGAPVIVACGGDGTVSAVAASTVDNDRTLAVLPTGTLNHFSKDLGIPQDISPAVELIAKGPVREVDICEINGRFFVNNSSIGLYPRIVRKREQQERLGAGKWWAAAWAALRFFWLSPFVRVRLEIGDAKRRRKTPFVFVGNNEYEMDIYNIGRRLRLDSGKMSIYLLRRGGRMGLVMLVLRTVFGSLRQAKDFEEFRAETLTIETSRKRVLVATDGEVSVMGSPLQYRIHPKRLKVIAPNDED